MTTTRIFCTHDDVTTALLESIGPAEIAPPARVGDVLDAVDAGARRIVLVDLDLDSRPRLGHHEVLDALRRGVAVAGGAGTGGLLAWDLRSYGAHPIGALVEHACNVDVVDESAIMRCERAGGVSLAAAEYTLAAAEAAEVIDAVTSAALTLAARSVPWQVRTWDVLIGALDDDDSVRLSAYLDENGDARRGDLLELGRWVHTPVAASSELPAETASWARARRALRSASADRS